MGKEALILTTLVTVSPLSPRTVHRGLTMEFYGRPEGYRLTLRYQAQFMSKPDVLYK